MTLRPTPVRYAGGKHKASKLLAGFIPEDVGVVYSPFFGGGSVELASGRKVVANDKDPNVVAFWRVASDPEMRKRLVDDVNELSEDLTYEHVLQDIKPRLVANYFQPGIETDRDVAAMYYVLNRCAWGGHVLTSCPTRKNLERYLRLGPRILADYCATDMADSIEEVCGDDWKDFLERRVPRDAFMFLDPPYEFTAPKRRGYYYGYKGDLHRNFVLAELKERLETDGREKWLMCHCDTPEARALFAGHRIEEWKPKEILIFGKGIST